MKNKDVYLQSLTKLDVMVLHENVRKWFYDYLKDHPQRRVDVIYIMEELIKSKC